ncbi:HAD family hydrolase [Robertkochia solimangrovi]|uniref:HAD family hydrolase n=1 Tax=Robertkochia solimangrovi TaxID=2213046 RepID=UPI0013A597B6|nr:HAD family hydrolase [Robertkochia solimangrovi]
MVINLDENSVVVFDLDDTLYNEIDYLISAYKMIAGKLDPENKEQLFDEMFTSYRQGSDTFQWLSERFDISKMILLQLYRAHFPEISPFKGVKDLLQAIKNIPAPIGLITDGRTLTQTNKLRSLDLLHYPDIIIISEELGTTKPHENNYLAVEHKFPGKSYIYIGDNLKKDFITPNRRGWLTIALRNNGRNIHDCNPDELSSEYLPTYFINAISDLIFP